MELLRKVRNDLVMEYDLKTIAKLIGIHNPSREQSVLRMSVARALEANLVLPRVVFS